MPQGSQEPGLGELLRTSREAMGLTLREVEQRTKDRIKNAYLSQVETGQIQRPSPEVIWLLAELYGLDYEELLISAGHRIRRESQQQNSRALHGIPLKALQSLNPEQRRQVTNYIAFLRQNSTAKR